MTCQHADVCLICNGLTLVIIPDLQTISPGLMSGPYQILFGLLPTVDLGDRRFAPNRPHHNCKGSGLALLRWFSAV